MTNSSQLRMAASGQIAHRSSRSPAKKETASALVSKQPEPIRYTGPSSIRAQNEERRREREGKRRRSITTLQKPCRVPNIEKGGGRGQKKREGQEQAREIVRTSPLSLQRRARTGSCRTVLHARARAREALRPRLGFRRFQCRRPSVRQRY